MVQAFKPVRKWHQVVQSGIHLKRVQVEKRAPMAHVDRLSASKVTNAAMELLSKSAILRGSGRLHRSVPTRVTKVNVSSVQNVLLERVVALENKSKNAT